MRPFAQLPLPNSDSLRCFCSLLIFQHAEFLLEPLVFTQETSSYTDKIQGFSYEMRSQLPS